MSEQDLKKYHKSNKPFGAPRMRASQLLDVMRDEGADTSNLEREIDQSTFISNLDAELDLPTKPKSNTYGNLAPKPSVFTQHPELSAKFGLPPNAQPNSQIDAYQASQIDAYQLAQQSTRSSNSNTASPAPRVPAVGSFFSPPADMPDTPAPKRRKGRQLDDFGFPITDSTPDSHISFGGATTAKGGVDTAGGAGSAVATTDSSIQGNTQGTNGQNAYAPSAPATPPIGSFFSPPADTPAPKRRKGRQLDDFGFPITDSTPDSTVDNTIQGNNQGLNTQGINNFSSSNGISNGISTDSSSTQDAYVPSAPATPPIGSFFSPPADTPAPKRRKGRQLDDFGFPITDQPNELDNLPEPEFDPNSAMAQLAALAGNTAADIATNYGDPSASAATPSMGHRRPSAGNPSAQNDFFEPPVTGSALPPVGTSFYATDEEIAQIDARVQQEIEQMAQEAANNLYKSEPNPYVSPAQRRKMRGSSQVVQDITAEDIYSPDRSGTVYGQSEAYGQGSVYEQGSGYEQGSSFGERPYNAAQNRAVDVYTANAGQGAGADLGANTITNNYIPDAAPMPMPTFTPNAYTSPYEDVAVTTSVKHVVDGEILDDFDPTEALTNEEYMAFLANKQAERELMSTQNSNEIVYHPWTLPKNRISKIELLQQKNLLKEQAEMQLNPRYRLQREVNDEFGGSDVSYIDHGSSQISAQGANALPPPPEAHLLAQDAAMGAPVDNPLLLQSEKGRLIASIDLKGGMLAQLIYQRDSGQLLDLLYHAPWLKDNYYFRSPNLEQHMAGEWPCIPFGWAHSSAEANRPIAQHGFACQGEWQLERVLHSQAEFLQFVDNPNTPEDPNADPNSACGVVLGFEYPEDLPLQKLVRSIYINDTDVLLNFTIYAKQDCKVPMAAYPLFPMNPENDLVMLDIEGDGLVYPRQYEPGVSRFLPKSHFVSLDSIALRKDFVNKDGNSFSVDATMLPLSYPTEEVVQMLNPNGRARLYYPNKQLHVVLKWESEKLPNCVVWISNGGRQYAPWEGNNYCVGIAPMIGTWDLADDALQPNNLVEQFGKPTYIQLKAGQPFSFSYSLFVEDLLPQSELEPKD